MFSQKKWVKVSAKFLLVSYLSFSTAFGSVAPILVAYADDGSTSSLTTSSAPADTSVTAPADTTTTSTDTTTAVAPAGDTTTTDTSVSTDTTSNADTSVTTETSTIDTSSVTTPTTDTTVTDTTTAPADTTTDSTSVTTDTTTTTTTTDVVSADSQAPPLGQAPSSDSSITTTDTTTISTSQTATVVQAPELSTDKTDYNPGQTATIFGKFFQSLQNVVLRIFGDSEPTGNYADTTVTVKTDDTGSFSYQYQLDSIYRPLYTVTANSTDGTLLAQTTFTDSVATDISQCQNGGIGDPLQPCNESDFPAASGYGYEGNANANGGNSHWAEGDFVPIRIVGTGYSAGAGNIQFSYDVTKGGKHAYDYIGSFDSTEATGATVAPHANHNNPCGDIAGVTGDCTDPVTPDSVGVIPTDTTLAAGLYPAVCGTNTWGDGAQPSGQNIKAWGTSGPLTVTYVSKNIGSGDCVTTLQVAWTATQASFGGTIVIGYAPHIARQADWGTGNSAVNIHGSPYHSSLVQYTTGGVTKGIGQQDAKLAASAVVIPNTITIHKVTSPAGGTGFGFTTTGGLTPSTFPLDDTQSISFSPAPGSYTVVENSPLPTYALTGLTCTFSGTGTSATFNTGTRTASITIGSAGGGNVDCIYTNTLQQGAIVVVKKTIGGDSTFNFNTTGGNGFPNPFSTTTVNGYATSTFPNINQGPYSVTEVVPTGWDLTNSSCTNGTPGSFTVSAGATTTCTFTNTKKGNIVVVKHTIGGNGAFTFNTTGGDGLPASFSTTTTAGYATSTYTNITPTTYSVAEAALADWDLTGSSCTSGTPASFTVPAGGTVTCTFTNTKRGHLIVDKVTVPAGDTTAFTIDATSGDGGTVTAPTHRTTLATNHSEDFEVIPGHSYSATESAQTGWTETGNTCSNVAVAAGQTVHCQITNTKLATIIINKVTDPASVVGQTYNYTTTGAGLSNFSLDTDPGTAGILATKTFSDLVPGATGGARTVVETSGAGFNTSLSCSSALGTSTISPTSPTATLTSTITTLGAGDTVTCAYTNTQKGTIVVVKHTIGGNGAFTFNTTGGDGLPASFSTTTTAGYATSTYTNITPNTYSVSETPVPAGWDLTGSSCTSGTPASFNVSAGGTVTCTFTNTKRGHIIVVKDAVPNDTQDFTFANNFGNGNPASFDLDNDGNNANTLSDTRDSEVLHGNYNVSETVPGGWKQFSATCSDGSPVNNIGVSAGETVTCTFVNHKLATIILVKHAIGGNDTFNFTTTGGDGLPTNPAGLITSGGWATSTFSNIDPDLTYSIVENTPPAGWAKDGISCFNESSTGSITSRVNTGFQPTNGGTVTCTFTNNKPAAQIDLSPLTATNKIGDNHIITATVQTQNGNGVWGPAANGTLVTFSIVNSNGATASFVGGNTCTTSAGSCSVTINSPTAGTVAIHASASPVVLGVTLTAATGTGGDNSADAAKTYVNAQITVTGNSTNEIDTDHTFTVTVKKDLGDGAGLVAASGAVVTGSITGIGSISGGTCSGTTDISGMCTIIVHSATAGTGTVHATVTLLLGTPSVSITRSTGDGLSGDSADTHKTWVDAKISIGQNGTNEIGNPHTFTGHVDVNDGTGFVSAPDGTTINFSLSGVGGLSAPSCPTAGGTGSCSVTDTSSVAGVDTVNASVTILVGGVSLSRTTNGAAGNSGPATKTWVDANIQITPDTATNKIGDQHTLTGHVNVNTGTGGFVNAPAGTTINFTKVSGPGTLSASSCLTILATGSCSVTLTSLTTGTTVVKAGTAVVVGGITLNRETGDGLTGDSVSATKHWVDLQITIDQNSTNEIGNPHTFTVTVKKDLGDGAGWVDANGETVTPSLTGIGSLTGTGTCETGTTTSGQCTIIVNSATAGTGTIDASTTVIVGGVSITRALGDSLSGDSAKATKTWVDANIAITPLSAINPIHSEHIFTVTVTQIPGGATPATTVNVTTSVTPTPDITNTTTCGATVPFVGNVATCTITINNSLPAVFTADASAALTIGGVALTRATGDSNAGDSAAATKTYEAGSLDVTKVILLGGYSLPVNGTFSVSVDGPSYPAPSASTTLTFTVTNGVVSGTQTLNNLIPGTYHVIENNPGIAWTATGGGNATVVANQTAHSVVTNTLKLPSTLITLTPNTFETTPGANVILTITDTNNGQVPISNPSVQLLANGVPTIPQPTYVSGDTNSNGVMDVGETWTWTVSLVISVDTQFTVNGMGTDPLGNPVNGPTYQTETKSITVKVIGTTRTLGFWQTHTGFTTAVATLAGGIKVGDVGAHKAGTGTGGSLANLASVGGSELFGGFYAPIAKTTLGVKRTPVDQARIQMLQQLLAAKLNCAAFGCSASITTLISDSDAAYALGASKGAINSLAGQLDTFNNSGDGNAIPSSLPATGKATPKTSTSYANLVFWNTP